MIYCVLDGDTIYPSMSQNIKITRENPDIKDKGSYTLDVTFPMSILENQEKFKHLNRIDVSMNKNKYSSASLYVDGTMVISGIGVITSVSNNEVKLQIMNENSEFKYSSNLDKEYLDEMMPEFYESLFTGKIERVTPGSPPLITATNFFELFQLPTMIDYNKAIESHSHVGDESIGIYTPVHDETNGQIVNEIVVLANTNRIAMINPACQYNLLYIMKQVMSRMGYTADISVIDCYPWNKIFIVNSGSGLPHWTFERFIDEFKKFFNVTISFSGKKAIFGRIDFDKTCVSYECLDEFTSEFDDDGLQINITSNLRYNLYDSSEKGTVHVEIPDSVMEKFAVREYESESAMYAAFGSLSDSQKIQSVFSTPTGYFYATHDGQYDNENRLICGLRRAGMFNKLIRNEESDNEEELGMVPVNMETVQWNFRHVKLESYGFTLTGNIITESEEENYEFMPTAECETLPEKEKVSVMEALEDTNGSENTARSESERMELFFLGRGKWRLNKGPNIDIASVGTDPNISSCFQDKLSFALTKASQGVQYIGLLHNISSKRINNHNQRCIKFLCDEEPDPTNIYIFHNKQYLCEKIEIQITPNGIDQIKTGYFYEITS